MPRLHQRRSKAKGGDVEQPVWSPAAAHTRWYSTPGNMTPDTAGQPGWCRLQPEVTVTTVISFALMLPIKTS